MWNLMNASLKALLNEQYKLVAELREENKKLKEYNWELIENHKKDIAILCEENKKLKAELEEVEKDLAHRDSFFSMMYDVLGNENVSSYLLYDIVNAVVKSECWAEEELDEEDLDCLKKFWEWFYKSF